MFKKVIKILIINMLACLILFLIINLASPYLFYNFLSTPGASAFIPEGIAVLNQSSKSSLLPKNYIGIFGDSYAFGYGDWLTEEMATPHAKYSAGHILYDKTGVDVISFGQVGAGSIRGMVGAPIAILEFLNKSLLYKVADPEIILIMFYEGNDLSDNIEYIAGSDKCISSFEYDKKFDAHYFSEYMKLVAIENNPLHKRAADFNFFDNLFLIHALLKIYKQKYNAEPIPDFYKCSPYGWLGRTNWTKNGKINFVNINGYITSIPDSLQGPSSDLTDDEIRFGLFSFEQALIFTKNKFPKSKIGIVYIPSTLSSYELVSSKVSTQPFIHKDNRLTTKEKIYERSDSIAHKISSIAHANNVFYIDARPYIRDAGKKDLIHGPGDWNHLNKKGYTALAKALVEIVSTINSSN